MKAAVCYAFNQPLVIEDVDIDSPGPGEVRVRLAATAVCHSDVHLIHGDWAGALPVIAGHESAGVVEEVGENVSMVKPGDRVVVTLLRSCGLCFHCLTGASYRCEGVFPLDSGTRIRNAHGQKVHPGVWVGGFAEHAIVDQSQVVRVPDDVPLDRAALLGCGVITGVGAVLNTARVPPGSSVVVIGTGGVGLNAIQGAVLAGANPIIAIDRVESKLEAARLFGATDAIHGDDPKAMAEMVRGLTSKRGADYVFVTVGAPEAFALALTMIRHGGTVVGVGMPRLGATIPVHLFHLVWREYKLIGSHVGSTQLQQDVPRLVDHYRAGRLKLDELITARYPLTDIDAAICSMESGNALRNVIVF